MTYFINRSREILFAEGIFLIIIGALIVSFAQTTTLMISFLLSLGIIFVGGYKVINSIITKKELSFPVLSIISGLLLLFIGIYLFLNPFLNLLVVTISIAIFFFLESILSFSNALYFKGFKKTFWLSIITGIMQLLLVITIAIGLPFVSLWFLGTLLGINFLLSGINSILVSFYLRKIAETLY